MNVDMQKKITRKKNELFLYQNSYFCKKAE